MLQSGKTIRLEMEGSDTELDKSLIEAIKAPLTHLVRNAIDLHRKVVEAMTTNETPFVRDPRVFNMFKQSAAGARRPPRIMVECREINLASRWPALPRMDVIFMRNVLIDVDLESKKTILAKVSRLFDPNGYLLLGGAETTMNLDDSFEAVSLDGATCFRLKGTPLDLRVRCGDAKRHPQNTLTVDRRRRIRRP